MRTEERRAAILRALHESDTPQSATALATRFSVWGVCKGVSDKCNAAES